MYNSLANTRKRDRHAGSKTSDGNDMPDSPAPYNPSLLSLPRSKDKPGYNIPDADGRGPSSSRAAAKVERGPSAAPAAQSRYTFDNEYGSTKSEKAHFDYFESIAWAATKKMYKVNAVELNEEAEKRAFYYIRDEREHEGKYSIVDKNIFQLFARAVELYPKRQKHEAEKEQGLKLAEQARMLKIKDEKIKKENNALGLSAIWAFDYVRVNGKLPGDVNKDEVWKNIKKKNTDPSVTMKRHQWSETPEGKDVESKLSDLGPITYQKVFEKLDSIIESTSVTAFGALYRGIDINEVTRWKQSVYYTPKRLTAFSEKESVARTFSQKSGWVVELQSGKGKVMSVNNIYMNGDEKEILFGSQARFKIIKIDEANKRIVSRISQQDIR